MPVAALMPRSANEWTVPAGALRSRIQRTLNKLIPYREFMYDYSTCGFYLRTVELGSQHMTRQGPYYYEHLSGLARMLGMFHMKNGVDLPPVTVIDKQGKEYPEKPLPPDLRFNILTKAHMEMISQLEKAGIKYSIPANSMQPSRAPGAPLTAPVTTHGPIIPEDDELTPEQEQILRGELANM